MQVIPGDQEFSLVFLPTKLENQHDILVPASLEDLRDRKTIHTSEIASYAIGHIPPEFGEELKAVDDRLIDLQSQTSPLPLRVFGPEDGDYYIELPGTSKS